MNQNPSDTQRLNQIESMYTNGKQEFPNVVDIMEDRDVDLEDADAVVTFWMDRMFPGHYVATEKQLAIDFLETDDDGKDEELDSSASNYAQRIRKLLALLCAYPQHQEQ